MATHEQEGLGYAVLGGYVVAFFTALILMGAFWFFGAGDYVRLFGAIVFFVLMWILLDSAISSRYPKSYGKLAKGLLALVLLFPVGSILLTNTETWFVKTMPGTARGVDQQKQKADAAAEKAMTTPDFELQQVNARNYKTARDTQKSNFNVCQGAVEELRRRNQYGDETQVRCNAMAEKCKLDAKIAADDLAKTYGWSNADVGDVKVKAIIEGKVPPVANTQTDEAKASPASSDESTSGLGEYADSSKIYQLIQRGWVWSITNLPLAFAWLLVIAMWIRIVIVWKEVDAKTLVLAFVCAPIIIGIGVLFNARHLAWMAMQQ